MAELPIVEADFNDVDAKGRILLDFPESIEDLRRLHPPAHSGMRVLFNSGDFSVEGVLEFENGRWYGVRTGDETFAPVRRPMNPDHSIQRDD